MTIAHAQSSKASHIDVYDGFETPSLNSSLWSNDRFEAGAVEMETNIVRAGHSAVKITVRSHNKFEAGTATTHGSERAELLEAKKFVSRENTSYEFSFSMFFPTNFPIEPTRLVIAQWKQLCSENGTCSDDSPVLALRYINGELRITQNINSPHETRLWTEKGEFRGRWLDFKFQTRFTTNDTGRVKAWLDGKQILDFKGVTADIESAATGYPSPSHFYFKMGLYRNSVPAPWTSYIDEYRKKELTDGELQ
ncbi:MAG TPA: polysaccharide lyase [Candidatus Polarisedimenticolia bacterium]|nr:polysaccharide lyase [Candidatus Polarisedimenticolia bacterium]